MKLQYSVTRYHDISCGHRVVGHEGKCRHLHGHNYRIHFHCRAHLDAIGRVIDFGVVKSLLCMWVEEHWDHKFLIWNADNKAFALCELEPESMVRVTFNPTAENMAAFLVNEVGPYVLKGTGVQLFKVDIEETRKCSASAHLE